jgi:hypothetical protein
LATLIELDNYFDDKVRIVRVLFTVTRAVRARTHGTWTGDGRPHGVYGNRMRMFVSVALNSLLHLKTKRACAHCTIRNRLGIVLHLTRVHTTTERKERADFEQYTILFAFDIRLACTLDSLTHAQLRTSHSVHHHTAGNGRTAQ